MAADDVSRQAARFVRVQQQQQQQKQQKQPILGRVCVCKKRETMAEGV